MCLDLLAFTENSDYTGVPADGPSWVPRWDRHIYTPYYAFSSRRHSSQFPVAMRSIPRLLDRNTLKVRGVRIGFVQYVTERLSHHMSLETISRVWREVERFGTSSHLSHNPYNASARTGFVGTLGAGDFRGDVDMWERREAAYMDYIERRASERGEGTEGDTISSRGSEEVKEGIAASAVEVHKVMMHTAHNRKIIVSDRGYYGLAPSAVEKGDAIYIIFGTTSPFLLRKAHSASHDGVEKYKLVGEMFMYSAVGAGSGKRLLQSGRMQGYDDWHDWGLQEQDILIC